MAQGVTRELSAFCAALDSAALPAEVVTRVRLLVTDLIGCIVCARIESPAAPALYSAAKALGLSEGSHRVFGDDRTHGAAGAAFLNAALAHALDFDDTHAAGTLHPGAPVIPAAIVAAEMVGASGADLIAAIVAGYEVTCRIAVALPAGDHYARGFHPTATCGVFGAAAAAGRVFGLSAERIEAALGIALSQSAGSLQFLVDGAWTKPFQVGWAAMGGLSAAVLARDGFRGPTGAIEGRHGFLQGYAPNPDPGRVVRDLGTVFETMVTGIKPYPSCRYGHAGIDAVLALRAEHDLRPEEVESITYGLSRAGLLLVGAPIEAKRQPVNLVGAQFSAPFVLSVALATGKMGWDSYKLLGDPVIHGLMQKVDCVHDPEIEAEFPANMSGRITIDARGTQYSRKVVVPLGEPANFLDEAALLAKFEGLTRPVLGDLWETLATAALALDKAPDMTRLADAGLPRS
jgi:2-methylcitrate dehydratase PrpD